MVTDPAREEADGIRKSRTCVPCMTGINCSRGKSRGGWSGCGKGARRQGSGASSAKRRCGDLIKWIAPVRERRVKYEKNPKQVLEILDAGSKKRRAVAQGTMERVREAVLVGRRRGKRLLTGESTRPAASKLPAADCLFDHRSQRHRKKEKNRFKDRPLQKKERMATPGTDEQGRTRKRAPRSEWREPRRSQPTKYRYRCMRAARFAADLIKQQKMNIHDIQISKSRRNTSIICTNWKLDVDVSANLFIWRPR